MVPGNYDNTTQTTYDPWLQNGIVSYGWKYTYSTTMTNEVPRAQFFVIYQAPVANNCPACELEEKLKKAPNWEKKRAMSIKGVELARQDYARLVPLVLESRPGIKLNCRVNRPSKRRTAKACRNWRRQK